MACVFLSVSVNNGKAEYFETDSTEFPCVYFIVLQATETSMSTVNY